VRLGVFQVSFFDYKFGVIIKKWQYKNESLGSWCLLNHWNCGVYSSSTKAVVGSLSNLRSSPSEPSCSGRAYSCGPS